MNIVEGSGLHDREGEGDRRGEGGRGRALNPKPGEGLLFPSQVAVGALEPLTLNPEP